MDNLVVGPIPQDFLNLACMQSFDLIQLLSAIVYQPAGKFAAVEIQAAHTLAHPERTANLLKTQRKQTLALADQRVVSPLIDHDVAHGFQIIRDPMLAIREPIFIQQNQNPDLCAWIKNARQRSDLQTARNDRRNAND